MRGLLVSEHRNSVDLVDIAWLLDHGDVVGASELLISRQAWAASDPHELVLWARVMSLRGRHGDASDALARALQIAPTSVDAHVEYARLTLNGGDSAGALVWFRNAYEFAEPSSSWVLEWVKLLTRHAQHERAAAVADRYCQAKPADAEGWFWFGYALQLADRLPEALDAYLRCGRVLPDRPMLRNNLAALYLQMQEYDLARFYAEEALTDDPYNALAWNNLAAAHLKRGEVDAAECAVERALALKPEHPVALQTFSYVCKEHQRWNQSVAAIERAHQFEPQDGSIRWSLAMLQLLLRQYEAGWRNYEYRWTAGELKGKWPELRVPVWRNQPLDGKALLVWGEQGYGDVLQFARFIPMLSERIRQQGGKLIYCAFPPLLSLLERSLSGSVDAVLPSTLVALPTCDYHLPLASLPMLLNIELRDLPCAVSYLKADPVKVAAWRAKLSTSNNLKFGLVWSGSRTHQRNRMRAVAPEAYGRAFADVEGVEFFNLQIDAPEALAVLKSSDLRVTDYSAEFRSFDDTAAFLKNLDLVITVCTSIAHLAGGLGMPTWLLLDVNPHWVWMTNREDSPWYPSIRLYRQPTFGGWEPVLQRAARDLAGLAGSGSFLWTANADASPGTTA
ncbi:tetratricopeptide repeat protein [Burkholderia sp. ABCPW 14]|uniref:tetratricopeptide repeat protein n=1 Tax=Burkholderia sp. ABCPW 14 TaxID=1637860 RepID=UPI000A5C94EA|nr:tetratricopeptide repeat protein [Burkholderia sp. ABCPW 14]